MPMLIDAGKRLLIDARFCLTPAIGCRATIKMRTSVVEDCCVMRDVSGNLAARQSGWEWGGVEGDAGVDARLALPASRASIRMRLRVSW